MEVLDNIEFVVRRVTEDGGWDEDIDVPSVCVSPEAWKDLMTHMSISTQYTNGYQHPHVSSKMQMYTTSGPVYVNASPYLQDDEVQFYTRTLSDIIAEDILLGED